jgi:hypothetical protein
MKVNPEPLKVVKVKAGDPATAERVFVVGYLRSTTRLRRLSVHLPGCARIPTGELWQFAEKNNAQVSVEVARAEQEGAHCSIECRTCGGWTVT